MNVVIVGTGYVGLTTGVALAHIGHKVTGVDKDPAKLELLRRRQSPIHEPGLDSMLKSLGDNISFTDDSVEAVADAHIIMIAVGTPAKQNGEADTAYVEQAAREIAQGLQPGRFYTLVIKSTVPIGTYRRVAHVVEHVLRERFTQAQVLLASNPEFLREGMALHDTLYLDRIVAGVEDAATVDVLWQLYRPILEQTSAQVT